jgi:putative ABC transport system permease protein
VTPLHNAHQPGVPPGVIDGVRVLDTEGLRRELANRDDGSGRSKFCPAEPPASCYVTESRLYVATPALLRYLGIDSSSVDPSTDFLVDRTVVTEGLVTVAIEPAGTRGEPKVTEHAVTNVERIDSRKLFGSPSGETGLAPTSFITLDGLRRLGWKQIPSGWLLESSRPLTSDQVADARDVAAEAGLTIEVRRESRSLATAIAIATAAGALLALAILAMTVGLIRSETAGDLRILTATGATGRTRRTLTAATAGALALLGALLGVAGAYAVLMATYHDDLAYLDVPVLYLVLIVVGVPLTAAAAGWLVAGREPPAVARPVLE